MAVEFDEHGQTIAESGNPEAQAAGSPPAGPSDPANPTSEALHQLLATADAAMPQLPEEHIHSEHTQPADEALATANEQNVEVNLAAPEANPATLENQTAIATSTDPMATIDLAAIAQATAKTATAETATLDHPAIADSASADQPTFMIDAPSVASLSPVINTDTADDAEPMLEESPAIEATPVLLTSVATSDASSYSSPEPAQDSTDLPRSLEQTSSRRSRDWEQRLSAARDFGMMAVRSALNVRQTLSAMSLVLRQTDVIFSGRHSQGTGRARPETTDGTMIVRIPADQMQQAGGIFVPAPPMHGALLATVGEPSTILFFYDGPSSVAQSLPAVQQLRSLGCNVLCVDYIGYGMSSGIPSEKSCYATAEAALDYLLSREDIDRRHIIACGHRMGAAVAVELAVRRHLSGLILVHPFTCMADAIKQSMPDLRMPLPLKHRFDCEARISRVLCPILLAHGLDSAQATVDPDQPDMIQRLFMAAHAPLCPVALDAADDIATEKAGITDQLIHEARSFITDLPPADPEVNPLRPTLLLPPKVPTKSRAHSTSAPRIREAC